MKRELGRRLGLPVGIGVLVAVTAIAIGTSGAGAATAHDGSAKKGISGGSHAKAKPPVRAALPAGAIKSIFVIELENESEQLAFGPSSPATYLNDVLRKQGELLVHYYATGHASLDNYISQISGQAPNEATSADCEEPSSPGSSTLVPDFVNVSPGTPARNQKQFPGQVNGTGCVFPKSVPTIANQLDTLYPPNPSTHVAGWRDYDEDMGNVPSRDGGTPDPLGGTDCAHPADRRPQQHQQRGGRDLHDPRRPVRDPPQRVHVLSLDHRQSGLVRRQRRPAGTCDRWPAEHVQRRGASRHLHRAPRR